MPCQYSNLFQKCGIDLENSEFFLKLSSHLYLSQNLHSTYDIISHEKKLNQNYHNDGRPNSELNLTC